MPGEDRDVPVVTYRELRALQARRPSPQLVHGGGSDAFRGAHIPGSLAFASVEQADAGLDASVIIVYGADEHDATARELARRLHARGRDDVRWYAGGLADWTAAGQRVEAAPRHATSRTQRCPSCSNPMRSR